MQQLNLPSYPFKLKNDKSGYFIFDSFRSKWLKLTPEEWVRQHFTMYLTENKNYPKGRIALEYSIKVNSMTRRCDAVVFSETVQPRLIVECKAPNVPINQKVFDQIAQYNLELKVEYLIVTNGLQHFACKIDYAQMAVVYLEDIPDYKQL